MKNVTLALDEETLEAGRDYAQRHKTTVGDRKAAASEMLRLMKKYPGKSTGARWTRAEFYGR